MAETKGEPMRVTTKARCPECGRIFDLLEDGDAEEWFYGHDCEEGGGPVSSGRWARADSHPSAIHGGEVTVHYGVRGDVPGWILSTVPLDTWRRRFVTDSEWSRGYLGFVDGPADQRYGARCTGWVRRHRGCFGNRGTVGAGAADCYCDGAIRRARGDVQ